MDVNVNEAASPHLIAVCGVKNSGKTTLLVKLVSILTGRGLRVAVIKHDGHDFACDIPGTDSWQFARAGAYGTAVYSAARVFVHKETADGSAAELARQFPEADVILLEGGKDSTLPKIEVVRRGISAAPVSNPAGRFLVVTDWPAGTFAEAVLSFEDTERIADCLLGALSYMTDRNDSLQK